MYWNWQKSGIALAACFLAAIFLVKPIGVSTQFVIANGIIAKGFQADLVKADPQNKSGYSSSNAYLNKSGGKYAKAVANPLSYGLVFVLSMIGGGFIARKRQKQAPPKVPCTHQRRFGNTTAIRYTLAFIGGFIVLIGARLAGGCTSGHMMSGMMQTALSAYVFTLAAFATAIPTALFLYPRKEQ